MDRAYEVPLYRTNAGYEIIDVPPAFSNPKMEYFKIYIAGKGPKLVIEAVFL